MFKLMFEEIFVFRFLRKVYRFVRKICIMLIERLFVLSNIGCISKIKCVLFILKLILLKSLENYLLLIGKFEKFVEDKCF